MSIILGFTIVLLAFSPIILIEVYRIPWGMKYSKWRVVQKGDEYWVEYKTIFGLWVSYWTWENTGYGVPYYYSLAEAMKFINGIKVYTPAKVVYTVDNLHE